MRRLIALAFTVAGLAAAGVLVASPAQAADGSCAEVRITTTDGRFEGWQCEDESGTAIGGRMFDTKTDGRCVALAVVFTVDGLQVSNQACEGVWWPQYVGVASSHHGVDSIDIISVPRN